MPKIHVDGRVTEAPGRVQSTGERPAPGQDSAEEVNEKREDRPSAGNSSTASSKKPSSSTKTK